MMNQIIQIEGNEIVIRVPIAAIANAADIAWDRRYGEHNISVVDADVFAKEIVTELSREQEDGTTPIDLMLDAACCMAAENGAFGLNTP